MSKYSKYIKIPFKPLGRDFNGCDCYGLVRLILLNEFDTELPSWDQDYTNTTDKKVLESCISDRYGYFEKTNDPKAGDIVLMRLCSAFPVHIGLMIDDKKFIHIRQGENVSTGKVNEHKYNRRIAGFYRWCVRL